MLSSRSGSPSPREAPPEPCDSPPAASDTEDPPPVRSSYSSSRWPEAACTSMPSYCQVPLS